jgi:putative acetyltransferase
MKRLYVLPDFQGRGIGRALATAILDAGRCAGYRAMRLDTVLRMTSAVGLYRTLGFVEIPPYAYNPEPDVLYFERVLWAAPLPGRGVRQFTALLGCNETVQRRSAG